MENKFKSKKNKYAIPTTTTTIYSISCFEDLGRLILFSEITINDRLILWSILYSRRSIYRTLRGPTKKLDILNVRDNG